MDSGRLFRAIVTFLTLLICLWVLSRLERPRPVTPVSPVDTTAISKPPPQQPAQYAVPPLPAEITTLPLVALDNTCLYDGAKDLSQCTGAISGGPVREYLLHANGSDNYFIDAHPRAELYDLSFVVYDSQRRCVIGQDERGPGFREAAILERLEAGVYTLSVGGYAEDCGPFELTISNRPPTIAQITQSLTLPGPNGTVVRWETFAEVDLAHFELFRETENARERIAVLRAHGTKAGFAFYRFLDRQPYSDSVYVIEAVARDGRREVIEV